MKTKTWKVISNRANKQTLNPALRKRRFNGRRTSVPRSLSIGWGLRAALMTILCDPYLSCKSHLPRVRIHLLP